MGLVAFVGLVLGEKVAQLVHALFVESLEGFEDEGGLGIPLLGGLLEPSGGICHLLRIRLRTLPSQRVHLFLGIFEVSGHSRQVGRDGLHILHLLSGLEVAQGRFDIFLEQAGELVMRVGGRIDREHDLVPGSRKDAGQRISTQDGG